MEKGFHRNPCFCMPQFGMLATLMKGGGLGLMWGVMHPIFASTRM